MRITNIGTIGIGTTTPQSMLSVGGGASIGADYDTAAPTNGLIVEGSTAINSATAGTYPLYVNGGIQYNSSTAGQVAGSISSDSNWGMLLRPIGGKASDDFLLTTGASNSVALTMSSAGNFGFNTSGANVSILTIAGSKSSTAWSFSGLNFAVLANTLTDTSSAGGSTIATRNAESLTQPTFAFNIVTSTITNAATLYIAGAPKSDGASSTVITNAHSLLIAAGALTGTVTTNGYGLTVNAPTGATNNYAAEFLGGNVGIGTSSPQSLLTVLGTAGTTPNATYPGTIQIVNNGGFSATAGTGGLEFVTSNSFGWKIVSPDLSNANTPLVFDYRLGSTAWSEGMRFSSKAAGVNGDFGIGIGTTSPNAVLDLAGQNNITIPLLQLSSVASFATTTEFIVNNNGNATLAGCLNYNGGTSGTCLSDERVKQDINPFTDSLQEIVGLDPVTYEYNGLAGTPSDGDVRTGLIAQQVQQVAPDLVSTTSAFLNASDTAPTTLLEVNYGALTFALINAVKEIASISGSFETNLIAWLGNASNGIVDLFANNIHAQNELCVGSTCITPQQFQAIVAAASQSGSSQTPPPASDATDIPPVIQINGDNPAIIQVGATYTDLGATIEGPQTDLNLGITTYVNGTEMNPVQIDTSTVATDTVAYVATDQTGLTSTTTRTVIIEGPSIAPVDNASSTAANVNAPPIDASSTAATTTSQ